MRIGKSTDIHRLEKEHNLIIGGINIPSDLGTIAHSDGDCLLHTVAESLIGALALGDLGKLFPDNDIKYKGIPSSLLVEKVMDIVSNKGYTVLNIDSMVFLEQPKLRPYIDKIRENIANLLRIDINQVSVKATTGEKIGIVGKREAIVCESIVLIQKK
jgi:2-C-methyl-D-erythritol 2,4-cyclodiphosphate synthase